MNCQYRCPSCSGTSTITRYSGNGIGAILHCDSCGRSLIFESYDPLLMELRASTMAETLEPYLKPCKCGGRLSASAPPRCALCRAAVEKEPLKAQIGPYFK